jgi:hypothetical protein
MQNSRLFAPLKVGLLLVAVSWFAFTFFRFISAVIHSANAPWYIMTTDTLGAVGLGFRTVAGFLALVTIVSYFFLRNISKVEAILSLRWILLLEATYYAVTFLPSALWGVSDNPFSNQYGELAGNLVANFFPCLLEGILIPVVLLNLFTKLGFQKPATVAVKAVLTAGTAYLVVYWFDNTANWIFAVMDKGLDYVSLPLNLLSFLVTVVGLAALAIYAGYFTKKSHANDWRTLSFPKIGAVVTLLGLYYGGIYLMWILVGSVGGWSPWYMGFLGHNVNLWLMTLPLVGVPLIFYGLAKASVAAKLPQNVD